MNEIQPKGLRLRYRGLLLVNRIVLILSSLFLGEWAIYGIFRCPFLVPFVSCQNCPVLTCPGQVAARFWGVWAAWLLVLAMLGRAFCSWFCPGGFVNRIFALNPFKFKPDLQAVQSLSYGKYITLFLVIMAYYYLGQPRVLLPIRAGEFFPAIGQTFDYATLIWLFRSCVVIFIFLAGLFLAQAWCRFACPMGGILELLKKFSLFKVFKTNACINCDRCRKVCYMQTRPQETNCTNCGDCTQEQVCPMHCIGIGRAPTRDMAYHGGVTPGRDKTAGEE